MTVIGEACYDAGVVPSIVFTFTPSALHPTNECTAVTVKTLSPEGVEATYTSPNAALSSDTHTEDIDGVLTTITEWTFTFPAPLTGSNRNPWYVKCTGTAGVLGSTTTSHHVARDVFA